MAKKRKMGRPTMGKNARSIPVMVKVSERELKVFKKAAKKAGAALGPWLIEARRKEFSGDTKTD